MNEDEKTFILSRSKSIVASFLGGTTGGLVGGAVAGPQGIVAGAFLGTVMEYALDDFGQRMLSRREAGRIADVTEVAAKILSEKLKLGAHLRDDGFFDSRPDSESPASQILEGVLLKAKNEHEQLKLPYLAQFLVNASLSSSYSPYTLNHLLALAERLTYRHMCLVRFANFNNHALVVRNQSHLPRSGKEIEDESLSIVRELFHLGRIGVLNLIREGPTSEYERANGLGLMKTILPQTPDEINPASVKLNNTGESLQHLLGLKTIPQKDINEIYWGLSWTARTLCGKDEFLALTQKELERRILAAQQPSLVAPR